MLAPHLRVYNREKARAAGELLITWCVLPQRPPLLFLWMSTPCARATPRAADVCVRCPCRRRVVPVKDGGLAAVWVAGLAFSILDESCRAEEDSVAGSDASFHPPSPLPFPTLPSCPWLLQDSTACLVARGWYPPVALCATGTISELRRRGPLRNFMKSGNPLNFCILKVDHCF